MELPNKLRLYSSCLWKKGAIYNLGNNIIGEKQQDQNLHHSTIHNTKNTIQNYPTKNRKKTHILKKKENQSDLNQDEPDARTRRQEY